MVNSADDEFAEYEPDAVVAKRLHKHPKSIARWDKRPDLKELGWPGPIYLNGRRHRHRPTVDAFLRRAAQAHLDKSDDAA